MTRFIHIAILLTLFALPAIGQTPANPPSAAPNNSEREKLTNMVRIAKQSATVTGDRGLFTVPSAETLSKGQFSIGAAWHNLDRTPTDLDINFFPVHLSYGVLGRLTVSAAFEMQRQVTARNLSQPGYHSNYPFAANPFQKGFGDTTLTIKYRLHQKKDNIGGIALRTFIKFPTSEPANNLGTNATDVGADVIFTSALPLGFLMQSNMGYTYTGNPTTPVSIQVKDELRSGFGAAWPAAGFHFAGGRAQGIIEYTTQTFIGCCAIYNTASAAIQNANDIAAGLRYLLLRPGLTMDFAYRNNTKFDKSFAGNENPHGLTFGLTFTTPGAIDFGSNRQPIVALETPATEIALGATAPITASTLDPDNDKLTYTWTATAGLIVRNATAPNLAAFSGPLGMHTVKVTVSDGRGGLATAEIEITVR